MSSDSDIQQDSKIYFSQCQKIESSSQEEQEDPENFLETIRPTNTKPNCVMSSISKKPFPGVDSNTSDEEEKFEYQQISADDEDSDGEQQIKFLDMLQTINGGLEKTNPLVNPL